MIKRNKHLKEFEKQQLQAFRPDYFRNLRIFEGLYLEAKQMGIFPLRNALEGIEVDIHLARMLNV